MNEALHTTVCIVGGGPAGIVLSHLLARQEIDVIVLEKHKDFNRDFRGDTIHGATLRVMQELDLLDALLQVQHQRFDHAFASLGDRSYQIADFVGSEVAHRVSPTLATVRRSNRACSFPAHGFHEDSLFRNAIEGIN
jgi:2-polyprenyl-6-methoxyphenol hydroxylase-like FAD-dependent oxidoreductase